MPAPWSFFAPHLAQPYPFFLDRDGDSSWSFAGSRPSAQLVVDRDGRARVRDGRRWRDIPGDPIDAIDAFVTRSESRLAKPGRNDADRVANELLDVPLPRTVGYLAYELGRFIETVPTVDTDPIGMPLAVLSSYDEIDAWHGTHGRVTGLRFEDAAGARACETPLPWGSPGDAARIAENSENAYRAGFARIAEAIRTGEIYQANLSRRIAVPSADPASEAYRVLREVQPVPQGAYLDLGPWQILSNSPECFLLVNGQEISTFPIKGTRARASDDALDRDAREQLLADPKERAEHVMIVDLERNDLGRICTTGSVHVPRHASVVSFRTLHHLESRVSGIVRPGCGIADVLRATFPGGSITGAPKIRAMQIIAEVEPCARGVYTGAIGAFNGAGRIELNIAIRTAVAAGGYIHYSTGGGIVADSGLESEYEETVTKAQALLKTLAVQAAGPAERAATS